MPFFAIFKSHFYPRSPCGERPTQGRANAARMGISIHALLAESDHPRARCALGHVSYNIFLSTLSLRRATLPTSKTLQSWQISIHALLAESDPPGPPCSLSRHTFLSTLSLRRATSDGPSLASFNSISIHALLAESDAKFYYFTLPKMLFLSTLSLRRATLLSTIPRIATIISIHALLAESDSKSAQNSGALLRIWNKFYGDCIFMLTGKAVFYPFCPCFFHIFWCEGSGNFMIAFPSH